MVILLQIDSSSADFQPVLNEQILLVTILDKLPEYFARQIRTVKYPFFHADKIFHKILVVHIFHEPHVFVNHQPGRIQQQEAEIHHICRNVAVYVHHPVRIDMLCPDMQQSFVGIKIRRGNRGDQVFDLVRIKRGIDDAKGAAHADAHEVDPGSPRYVPG